MKSGQIRVITMLAILQLMAVGVMAQSGGKKKMMKLPDSQAMLMSAYDFNDTVELLTAAIEEKNLMVVKVINAQQMLKMANKKVGGMKQLLFFHPRYMKRIVETNPMGAIEPPLKLAVMERPDGKVVVKYIRPSHMFGGYKGLKELGLELDDIIAEISSSVKN